MRACCLPEPGGDYIEQARVNEQRRSLRAQLLELEESAVVGRSSLSDMMVKRAHVALRVRVHYFCYLPRKLRTRRSANSKGSRKRCSEADCPCMLQLAAQALFIFVWIFRVASLYSLCCMFLHASLRLITWGVVLVRCWFEL